MGERGEGARVGAATRRGGSKVVVRRWTRGAGAGGECAAVWSATAACSYTQEVRKAVFLEFPVFLFSPPGFGIPLAMGSLPRRARHSTSAAPAAGGAHRACSMARAARRPQQGVVTAHGRIVPRDAPDQDGKKQETSSSLVDVSVKIPIFHHNVLSSLPSRPAPLCRNRLQVGAHPCEGGGVHVWRRGRCGSCGRWPRAWVGGVHPLLINGRRVVATSICWGVSFDVVPKTLVQWALLSDGARPNGAVAWPHPLHLPWTPLVIGRSLWEGGAPICGPRPTRLWPYMRRSTG